MTLPALFLALAYGWLRRLLFGKPKRKIASMNYTQIQNTPWGFTTTAANESSTTYTTTPTGWTTYR